GPGLCRPPRAARTQTLSLVCVLRIHSCARTSLCHLARRLRTMAVDANSRYHQSLLVLAHARLPRLFNLDGYWLDKKPSSLRRALSTCTASRRDLSRLAL